MDIKQKQKQNNINAYLLIPYHSQPAKRTRLIRSSIRSISIAWAYMTAVDTEDYKTLWHWPKNPD